jgi:hypothetical protein
MQLSPDYKDSAGHPIFARASASVMKDSARSERRKSQRLRMIKRGTVVSGAASLQCAVLDVSQTGARVLLLDSTTAPEVCLLSLPDGSIRAAQRAWQRDREAGFTFLLGAELDHPA